MHMCPMDNELFHNNLTFLSRYIHLFNGKKIIHVAQSRFYDPDKPADHNNLLPTKLEQSDQGTIEKRILQLLENPELAKEISENNYKKSKNFDWDIIYNRYMEEYKKLLSKKVNYSKV